MLSPAVVVSGSATALLSRGGLGFPGAVVRRSGVPRFRIRVFARRDHRFVDRRGVRQCCAVGRIVLVGTLRYPDDVGNLRLTGAAAHSDAARVNALLL